MILHRILTVGAVLSSAAIISVSAAAEESKTEPSIKILERLIGTWNFVDAATEEAGCEYSETGMRVCGYALDDKYIKCESKGTARGKDRTYVFFFNYKSAEERFEMLAMFGDYPRKIFYQLQVSDDGKRNDLMEGPNLEAGEPERSWGTIAFQSDNQFT